MDNAALDKILKTGDQVQLFFAKPKPDGTPRELMVVWRGNDILLQGPIDQTVLAHPCIVKRSTRIQLPVHVIEDFTVKEFPHESME